MEVVAICRQEPADELQGCTSLEVIGGLKRYARIFDGSSGIEWGWVLNAAAIQVWPRTGEPGEGTDQAVPEAEVQASPDEMAAVDRYQEFEVEHYIDSWAIFGKGSDYPIAAGAREDMTIIADLLNTRAQASPA